MGATIGKKTYSNAVFEGYLFRDKRNGQGKLEFISGDSIGRVIEGNWNNDKLNG